MRRFLLVASAGVWGTEIRAQSADPTPSFAAQFDALWAAFDSSYSYFDLKKVDWNALRLEYRPRAERASTQRELIDVLREMVSHLRDVHAWFISPSNNSVPTYIAPTAPNWHRGIWMGIVDGRNIQLKPNLSYAIIDSVAYVTIGSWNGSQFSRADLDTLVERIRNARAAVIDVRPNGGGDDGLAFALAGRFTAREITTGFVRYRKGPRHSDFGDEMTRRLSPRGEFQYTRPVIVLAGRGVYSSNESFVAAMRELPNVTIMGDTTGGATGNPKRFPLAAGWAFMVPTWIELTADRRMIEWNGIPPDEYIKWDATLVSRGVDPVLEAAFRKLRASLAR